MERCSTRCINGVRSCLPETARRSRVRWPRCHLIGGRSFLSLWRAVPGQSRGISSPSGRTAMSGQKRAVAKHLSHSASRRAGYPSRPAASRWWPSRRWKASCGPTQPSASSAGARSDRSISAQGSARPFPTSRAGPMRTCRTASAALRSAPKSCWSMGHSARGSRQTTSCRVCALTGRMRSRLRTSASSAPSRSARALVSTAGGSCWCRMRIRKPFASTRMASM